MNSKDSAFNDALVTVATSNTVTYLVNRLRPHPLVLYLADTFSPQQLEKKLLIELKSFDKSLQKTTVILLLTQAILNKAGNKPLPNAIYAALQKSRVMWVHDLVSLAQASKRDSTVTITRFRCSPRLQSHSSASSTSRSFTTRSQS